MAELSFDGDKTLRAVEVPTQSLHEGLAHAFALRLTRPGTNRKSDAASSEAYVLKAGNHRYKQLDRSSAYLGDRQKRVAIMQPKKPAACRN